MAGYSDVKKLDEKSLKNIKEAKGPSDECICAILSSPEPKTSIRGSIKKVLSSLGKGRGSSGRSDRRVLSARNSVDTTMPISNQDKGKWTGSPVNSVKSFFSRRNNTDNTDFEENGKWIKSSVKSVKSFFSRRNNSYIPTAHGFEENGNRTGSPDRNVKTFFSRRNNADVTIAHDIEDNGNLSASPDKNVKTFFSRRNNANITIAHDIENGRESSDDKVKQLFEEKSVDEPITVGNEGKGKRKKPFGKNDKPMFSGRKKVDIPISVANQERVILTNTTKELVTRDVACNKCGCDNEKFVLKHSYANIKITTPDISSMCPCDSNCLPGSEKLNDIKVTIDK